MWAPASPTISTKTDVAKLYLRIQVGLAVVDVIVETPTLRKISGRLPPNAALSPTMNRRPLGGIVAQEVDRWVRRPTLCVAYICFDGSAWVEGNAHRESEATNLELGRRPKKKEVKSRFPRLFRVSRWRKASSSRFGFESNDLSRRRERYEVSMESTVFQACFGCFESSFGPRGGWKAHEWFWLLFFSSSRSDPSAVDSDSTLCSHPFCRRYFVPWDTGNVAPRNLAHWAPA